MNEDSLLRSCFSSLLRSFILRPTSSSALWYFSCRALDAITARTAASLGAVLRSRGPCNERPKGPRLGIILRLSFEYYFVFVFCTRFIHFIVIILYILFTCNYLIILHKYQHIPVHCNQFGWLTCREMFADENPSSSCRNYRGKSGEGRNSPTVFSRAIARRATSQARRQSGRLIDH